MCEEHTVPLGWLGPRGEGHGHREQRPHRVQDTCHLLLSDQPALSPAGNLSTPCQGLGLPTHSCSSPERRRKAPCPAPGSEDTSQDWAPQRSEIWEPACSGTMWGPQCRGAACSYGSHTPSQGVRRPGDQSQEPTQPTTHPDSRLPPLLNSQQASLRVRAVQSDSLMALLSEHAGD